MKTSGTNTFQTAMGFCGLAWTQHGIVGVQLPETNEAVTRDRLMERFPELRETPAPPTVRSARDDIIALLEGYPRTLSSVVLDMQSITPFRRDVYNAARQNVRGEKRTYGELAKRLGAPGSAPSVGQALGCNPYPLIVPCHRVLAAGGKAGGFSAAGGVSTKLRILALEGVNSSPMVDAKDEFAAAVDHLRVSDKILARTIDTVGPCLIKRKPATSTFAALAEAIVYQQLNGRAAETIFGRVRALMPHSSKGPRAADLLKTDDVDLRGAGLSQAKMLALQDLARRTVAGEIPTLAKLTTLDDESIIQRLTVVRGIGRWTVEMLLMFRLGRLDVLPLDDFGIREGYAVAFRRGEQPTRQALAQHGERWRPYRSVASWYLWRALERARQAK